MDIPFVHIKAKNNFDFGLKLGRALSKNIRARIASNMRVYKKMGVSDFTLLREKVKKFKMLVCRANPCRRDYIEYEL